MNVSRCARAAMMPSASATGSSAATVTPSRGVTNSSGPPHRVNTSGVPHASASAATEQNVSRLVDDTTTNAQRRIASATAGRAPERQALAGKDRQR